MQTGILLKRCFIFFVLCLALASISHAIIYVDNIASITTRNGDSWGTAYNSIQTAVWDADSVTTDIWVANGVYSETVNILSSNIKIFGGFEGYGGAEETGRDQRDWNANISNIDRADLTGTYGVYITGTVSVQVDGLTISNARNSYEGGSVRCRSLDNTNIIKNCIITGSTSGIGGGIHCYYASPQIINCTISDNTADLGAGIYCNHSSPDIINCVFHDNSANNYGGAMRCYQDSSPLIMNCTFSANSGSPGGAIACMYGASPLVVNSIVEDNTGGAIYEMDASANVGLVNNLFFLNPDGAFADGDTAYTYSDSETGLLNQNVPEATGNINGNPGFKDKSSRDFHLVPCNSAALDEGTSPSLLLFDRDLNPRPVDYPGFGIDGPGEGIDIGAYEAQQIAPVIDVTPLYLDFGSHYINQGASSPQSITVSNWGDAPLTFNSFIFSPDFYLAPNQDTSNLGICMSRTLDIVFDPSISGTITGTLDILTNDPISSTVTVDLEGVGLNSPPEALACTGNPYSLDFDGTYDYINCGSSSSLMPTSSLTVEAWINAEVWETNVYEGTILSKLNYYYSSGWRRRGYALRAGNSGRLEFIIGNNYDSWRSITSSSIMNTGTWHHVAGVYNGSTLTIYIDGVYRGSVDDGATPGIGYSSRSLYIGDCPEWPGRRFNGIIDEVRIWNIARSQSDIQNHMNKSLTGNEAGLAGYWRFDEGSGNMAYDSSNNTNNGTLYGMPEWITDAPDLSYYEELITTEDDIDTTITICGIDPDGDPLWGVITTLPITGTGDMYQYAGVGPVRGALIDSVPTTLTDPGRNGIFVPVDMTINYNTFIRGKVNDGYADSPNEITYTITVLDNDAPVLVNNVPQSLAKGDTLLYTSPTLYATDFEDIPENITYTLTAPPTHGTLWVDGIDLEQDDAFTQADINDNLLSYVHSSIGMDQEVFNFTLTDGAGLVTGPYTSTIDIIFTPAPQVYVDLNSPGPILDGGSWASAHHSLAVGVLDAQALGLTEVWVANGTYMEQVDMPSGVEAYAGFEGYGGAEETALSQRDWLLNICTVEGPEHGRAFRLNNTSSSIIHGFIVTGTGILCEGADSSTLITQCIIRENTNQSGGGIFMNGASPQITQCLILDNTATREGGGIYMRNNSAPHITACVLSGNSAEEEGGAFYCRNSADAVIVNCIIANNSATHGGAMYVRQNSQPWIVNSTVSGNIASDAGGGIFCDDAGVPIASNTIFEDNNEFAIYEGDDTANVSVMNCLFWGNPDGAFRNSDGAEYMDEDVADLNNDIPEAMNNITGDPQFVDKPMHDFHLRACSAALDQGIPNLAPAFDKDGNTRPYDLPLIGLDGPGQGFDIGAYELHTTGTMILVEPLSVNFGAQFVNQGATDPQTVTITNEGIEALDIFDIAITGSDAYSFATPPASGTMGICEQWELEIVFDPSELGPTTGTLAIQSNDPDDPLVNVLLTGTGINTPPVAGVPGPGGDIFAMNTDEDTPKLITVTGYDEDGDDITAWVTEIPELGKGAIHQYQGPGAIPGDRIATVPTQVTDPMWRLVYVPDGAIANYATTMKWKMNDGFTDSLNEGLYNITVVADDDPAAVVNSSLVLAEGNTGLIAASNLLSTGDHPISYLVDSLPAYGQLQLDAAPLGVGDEFTQDDVNLGRVSYAHDGSETTSDSFMFSLQDVNSGWIPGNTFTITITPVNDAPVLEWSRELHIEEGATTAILQIHLFATDAESAPSEIVYTVTMFPMNGYLQLNGVTMSLGGVEKFSQADIDAGLLTYTHTASNMDPDAFLFTFTDGEYVEGPEEFIILISFKDRKGSWWMMR